MNSSTSQDQPSQTEDLGSEDFGPDPSISSSSFSSEENGSFSSSEEWFPNYFNERIQQFQAELQRVRGMSVFIEGEPWDFFSPYFQLHDEINELEWANDIVDIRDADDLEEMGEIQGVDIQDTAIEVAVRISGDLTRNQAHILELLRDEIDATLMETLTQSIEDRLRTLRGSEEERWTELRNNQISRRTSVDTAAAHRDRRRYDELFGWVRELLGWINGREHARAATAELTQIRLDRLQPLQQEVDAQRRLFYRNTDLVEHWFTQIDERLRQLRSNYDARSRGIPTLRQQQSDEIAYDQLQRQVNLIEESMNNETETASAGLSQFRRLPMLQQRFPQQAQDMENWANSLPELTLNRRNRLQQLQQQIEAQRRLFDSRTDLVNTLLMSIEQRVHELRDGDEAVYRQLHDQVEELQNLLDQHAQSISAELLQDRRERLQLVESEINTQLSRFEFQRSDGSPLVSPRQSPRPMEDRTSSEFDLISLTESVVRNESQTQGEAIAEHQSSIAPTELTNLFEDRIPASKKGKGKQRASDVESAADDYIDNHDISSISSISCLDTPLRKRMELTTGNQNIGIDNTIESPNVTTAQPIEIGRRNDTTQQQLARIPMRVDDLSSAEDRKKVVAAIAESPKAPPATQKTLTHLGGMRVASYTLNPGLLAPPSSSIDRWKLKIDFQGRVIKDAVKSLGGPSRNWKLEEQLRLPNAGDTRTGDRNWRLPWGKTAKRQPKPGSVEATVVHVTNKYVYFAPNWLFSGEYEEKQRGKDVVFRFKKSDLVQTRLLSDSVTFAPPSLFTIGDRFSLYQGASGSVEYENDTLEPLLPPPNKIVMDSPMSYEPLSQIGNRETSSQRTSKLDGYAVKMKQTTGAPYNYKLVGPYITNAPKYKYPWISPKTHLNYYTNEGHAQNHDHRAEASRIALSTQWERLKAGVGRGVLFKESRYFLNHEQKQGKNKDGVEKIYANDKPTNPNNDKDPHLTSYWLGHASVLLDVPTPDGKTVRVLTDPVDGPAYSKLAYPRQTRPGCNIEDIGQVDVLLLTHNHFDHFSDKTLKKLVQHQPVVLVPPGDAERTKKLGFTKVRELNWWQQQSIQVDIPSEENGELIEAKIRITATPARHWSCQGLTDAHRSLFSGYVIENDALPGAVYFAGDTARLPKQHLNALRQHFSFMTIYQPGGPDENRADMAPTHQSSADGLWMFGEVCIRQAYDKVKHIEGGKEDFLRILEETQTLFMHTNTFKLGNLHYGDTERSIEAVTECLRKRRYFNTLKVHEQQVVRELMTLCDSLVFKNGSRITFEEMADIISRSVRVPKIGERTTLGIPFAKQELFDNQALTSSTKSLTDTEHFLKHGIVSQNDVDELIQTLGVTSVTLKSVEGSLANKNYVWKKNQESGVAFCGLPRPDGRAKQTTPIIYVVTKEQGAWRLTQGQHAPADFKVPATKKISSEVSRNRRNFSCR